MRLKYLLNDVDYIKAVNYRGKNIKKITDRIDEVKPGSLFVAIKGNNIDGHEFLKKAIKKDAAAVAILKEKKISLEELEKEVGIIVVSDTRKFLSKALSKYYDFPYKEIDIFGVTGTNGKTTVCCLLEEIFSKKYNKVGKFTTLDFNTGNKQSKCSLTTPDVFTLQKGLKEMVRNGCNIAIVEASSHGISQYRIDPEEVKVAIFTNISHDHLDYHENMEKYIAAKKSLFENLRKSSYAVLNKDESVYDTFSNSTDAKIISYGIKNKSDIIAKDIKMDFEGTEFKLIFPNGKKEVKASLLGIHNVYNILAAAAVYYVEDENLNSFEKIVNNFPPVEGRLQEVKNNLGFKVIVDYAHTPDSLFQVLKTLRNHCKGNIILVFGCGGNRDKQKRPKMGKIASLHSDFFILTNDNPRGENPYDIICDVKKGIEISENKYNIILDREKAISEAINMAKKDDVVIITGKGHEKYQIFKNKKIRFDDIAVSKDILAEIQNKNVKS